MEDWPCCRQSKNFTGKTNGQEKWAWPELQTENRGGGFAKELGE